MILNEEIKKRLKKKRNQLNHNDFIINNNFQKQYLCSTKRYKGSIQISTPPIFSRY
ncbi:Hypothetical protein EAG7_04981 [Klebsiella aerogenes]|nr:Hypothetical protein EAG7_04981 [Klebsiella aerogenes]PVF76604.1 hypothetical protein CSC18_1293 [Klebsiella aerogenes]CCG33476.1 hypothetical protein [Klebsiella aerogenes EA1509E]